MTSRLYMSHDSHHLLAVWGGRSCGSGEEWRNHIGRKEGCQVVWTRDDISEATGFDHGDLFRSEEQVREYFSVSNIEAMFGECPYTQPELDEMAEEVIRHRWHMALPVDEYRSVYNDGRGIPHEAIQIPWDVVTDLLGREHRGTQDDDAFLVDYLLWSGAPEWVRDATGWTDERGWGLIGPEVDRSRGR